MRRSWARNNLPLPVWPFQRFAVHSSPSGQHANIQYWPPCSVLDFHMTWYHGNWMFRSNVMCKLSKCSICLTFPMRPLPTRLADNQLVVSHLPFISVHMHFWRYHFTILTPHTHSTETTAHCTFQWTTDRELPMVSDICFLLVVLCWYSFRGRSEWGKRLSFYLFNLQCSC